MREVKRSHIESTCRDIFGADVDVEFGTMPYSRGMTIRVSFFETLSGERRKFSVEFNGKSLREIGQALTVTFHRIQSYVMLLWSDAAKQGVPKNGGEMHVPPEGSPLPSFGAPVAPETPEEEPGE